MGRLKYDNWGATGGCGGHPQASQQHREQDGLSSSDTVLHPFSAGLLAYLGTSLLRFSRLHLMDAGNSLGADLSHR